LVENCPKRKLYRYFFPPIIIFKTWCRFMGVSSSATGRPYRTSTTSRVSNKYMSSSISGAAATRYRPAVPLTPGERKDTCYSYRKGQYKKLSSCFEMDDRGRLFIVLYSFLFSCYICGTLVMRQDRRPVVLTLLCCLAGIGVTHVLNTAEQHVSVNPGTLHSWRH